jgi:hypothetical protein
MKLNLPQKLMVFFYFDVIFRNFSLNLTSCMTILKVLMLCFPYFMYYYIVCYFFIFKKMINIFQ